MALNYTITHNGSTWSSTTPLSSITLLNGSTTSSITTAGTYTLATEGKYIANDLKIGAATLACAGCLIEGDIMITATNAGSKWQLLTTAASPTTEWNVTHIINGTNGTWFGVGSHTGTFSYSMSSSSYAIKDINYVGSDALPNVSKTYTVATVTATITGNHLVGWYGKAYRTSYPTVTTAVGEWFVSDRTITFPQEITDASLLTWLQNNATLIY